MGVLRYDYNVKRESSSASDVKKEDKKLVTQDPSLDNKRETISQNKVIANTVSRPPRQTVVEHP